MSPRTSGDGVVLSTDVTQMRRFATGLDTPDPLFNEQQRADSAPRSTLGDGVITSADVVQARRYAAGLDPLTDAGGPTSPLLFANRLIDAISGYTSGRVIRVGSIGVDSSSNVTVPIEFNANGDETAIGFTIEYDAARLGQPRVALGDELPEGSVLTVNVLEDGRIAILIDSAMQLAPPNGVIRLATITFTGTVENAGPIVFGSSIATKSVSDAFGHSLPVRWIGRE